MSDDLVLRLRELATQTVPSPAPHLSGDAVFYVYAKNTRATLIEAADTITALRAEVERMAKENRILEMRNRGTLANNLCPDHRDKQQGNPCLACTIETLERKGNQQRQRAERAEARIADSATASVKFYSARAILFDFSEDAGEFMGTMLRNPDGVRVALVLLDTEEAK